MSVKKWSICENQSALFFRAFITWENPPSPPPSQATYPSYQLHTYTTFMSNNNETNKQRRVHTTPYMHNLMNVYMCVCWAQDQSKTKQNKTQKEQQQQQQEKT